MARNVRRARRDIQHAAGCVLLLGEHLGSGAVVLRVLPPRGHSTTGSSSSPARCTATRERATCASRSSPRRSNSRRRSRLHAPLPGCQAPWESAVRGGAPGRHRASSMSAGGCAPRAADRGAARSLHERLPHGSPSVEWRQLRGCGAPSSFATATSGRRCSSRRHSSEARREDRVRAPAVVDADACEYAWYEVAVVSFVFAEERRRARRDGDAGAVEAPTRDASERLRGGTWPTAASRR